ncbi:MAG TPA: RNA polymerase sigma factor [Planctomycetota bacterium]|nr:RNA polymerase sigma factor [Planctomycetota bacterium]
MDVRADPADQIVALLPRLRRFATSLCRAPQEVDDLVQATVERALNRIDQWRPDTRLDSWMFRILQNLWIDQLRARKPTDDLAEAERLPGVDGRQVTETHMAVQETRAAMAELPEEQRAVVMLVLVEGFAYREAAEILSIPIGTVMSRLSRAREALEKRLVEPARALRAGRG